MFQRTSRGALARARSGGHAHATRARAGALLPVLAGGLLGTALLASGASAPWDRIGQDQLVRLSLVAPPAPAAHLPDVAVVALDARSLRALPGWPWPRRHHAGIVRALAGAGAEAVAFDLDFSTPRPHEDAAFATALRDFGRAHLAAYRQVEEVPGIGELEVVNRPTPELAEAAAGVGHVVVVTDPDGAVRRGPPVIALGAEETPALALSVLGSLRADAAAAAGSASGDGSRVTAAPTPASRMGRRIDYRRALPAIPTLSAVDVLEGRFDAGQVAGRVVFVGATAVEFQDLWPTPLGPAEPGVWIQAVAYRTWAAAAEGAPVLRASTPASLLLVWGAVWVSAALGAGAGRQRHLALPVSAGLSTLAACGLASWLGLLVAPVPALAALLAQYAGRLEGVQRILRRAVAERDQSLTAVFDVGATGVRDDGEARSGLEVGLLLLGEVIGARAVAMLRATPDGRLAGERLDWHPGGARARVHPETARGVLAGRELRVFSGRVPTDPTHDAGAPDAGLVVYAPLHAGSQAMGVLVVDRDDARPLGETQLRTLATVASQLALQARNLRLVEDLRDTLNASVEAVASAVEARDGYTEMHCRRLALFSVTMGRRLGLPDTEIEGIRLGALLHDVGKIGIPDRVLLKPGRFSQDERAIMESHTEIGHRIVAPIRGLPPATLACVRHHHERFDGTGYPLRLAGTDIPLAARIVSVVDVWDALSSARPYKPALPQERVRELLHKGRGAQFDPELLDLFFRVLDEEGDEMLALVAGASPDPAQAQPRPVEVRR